MRETIKEILVVGATGTVGSEVLRALLARGVTPRALVRPESTAKLPRGVRLIPGTLANRGDAERAVDGVESAFFVPPHAPDEGTLGATLLAACRNAGVKRFVFSSAYRPAASNRLSLHAIHWLIGYLAPHYKQRLALERRVLASRMSTVVLLPSNFFQNDLVLRDAILGGAYPQPLGEKKVNRVDCADVGEAAARALTSFDLAPGAYPVVGSRSHSGPECAAIWSDALGRTVRHILCSDEWRRSSRALGEYKQGSYAKTFGLLQRFGHPTRERDVAMTTELLGRPPRDYTDFVRCTAAAWTEGPSPIRCRSSRDRDGGKEVAFSSSPPPPVMNLSVPLSTTGVSVEGHRP
jgi:uncharacterized protein YbjT (DUF2867 family)